MKITDSIAKDLAKEIDRMESSIRCASEDIRELEERIATYQAKIRSQQEYIDSYRFKIELYRKALYEHNSGTDED